MSTAVKALKHASRIATLACALGVSMATSALAQGAGISFGGLQNVRGLPVELAADSLEINNQTGESIMRGNAVLGQGDMRLAAPEIRIYYAAGAGNAIERLEASGGVTLVTAQEAAEAQSAVYDVAAATVRMTGSVILTQGASILSGESLFVDLRAQQGRMEGRVRSIVQTQP
ncbi:MAG: LptA/OstA family protein [Roseinatronobacter sp.]